MLAYLKKSSGKNLPNKIVDPGAGDAASCYIKPAGENAGLSRQTTTLIKGK